MKRNMKIELDGIEYTLEFSNFSGWLALAIIGTLDSGCPPPKEAIGMLFTNMLLTAGYSQKDTTEFFQDYGRINGSEQKKIINKVLDSVWVSNEEGKR